MCVCVCVCVIVHAYACVSVCWVIRRHPRPFFLQSTHTVHTIHTHSHTHTHTSQVDPQFYAFRWITLLLSQEFAFPDLLRIWDTILG